MHYVSGGVGEVFESIKILLGVSEVSKVAVKSKRVEFNGGDFFMNCLHTPPVLSSKCL